jgi:hypothetical protein
MIDPTSATEVVIRRYHETQTTDPYHEWRAPRHSEHYAEGRNECFLEAVDDERFEVEVCLHPLFDFYDTPQVRVGCQIDGGVVDVVKTKRKPNSWKTDQKALRMTFKTCRMTIAGVTRCCGYQFSKSTMSM